MARNSQYPPGDSRSIHVEDLARAYEAAISNREAAGGQAFNIGGGQTNTLSLRELLAYLEETLSTEIPLKWSDWRPRDQPVFVCNVAKAKNRIGWEPRINVRDGVGQLIGWVRDNARLFDWLK